MEKLFTNLNFLNQKGDILHKDILKLKVKQLT